MLVQNAALWEHLCNDFATENTPLRHLTTAARDPSSG
jgi:hypothetical protein